VGKITQKNVQLISKKPPICIAIKKNSLKIA